jgi:hypothetical protein
LGLFRRGRVLTWRGRIWSRLAKRPEKKADEVAWKRAGRQVLQRVRLRSGIMNVD